MESQHQKQRKKNIEAGTEDYDERTWKDTNIFKAAFMMTETTLAIQRHSHSSVFADCIKKPKDRIACKPNAKNEMYKIIFGKGIGSLKRFSR